MKFVWTEPALQDLEGVRAYISDQNPRAAGEVARAILSASTRLLDFPHLGRPGRVAFSRELIIPGFPFILGYTVLDGRVEILAVIHESRKWPDSR